MYRDHVPQIARYALTSPVNLGNVVTFALLSIRQPFYSLTTAVKDVRRNGRNSAYLWGWKQGGYDFVQGPRWAGIFDRLQATVATRAVVPAVDILANEVPGLGIVKGSFVAQMLGLDTACFDTRNMQELGISPRSFREIKPGTKEATRHKRIAAYVQFAQETGGAEHWWDHWCTGIAPGIGMTADAVSALHVTLPTYLSGDSLPPLR